MKDILNTTTIIKISINQDISVRFDEVRTFNANPTKANKEITLVYPIPSNIEKKLLLRETINNGAIPASGKIMDSDAKISAIYSNISFEDTVVNNRMSVIKNDRTGSIALLVPLFLTAVKDIFSMIVSC